MAEKGFKTLFFAIHKTKMFINRMILADTVPDLLLFLPIKKFNLPG